jgi:Polyketide cyclase / dehydrase and lipid transport
LQPAGNNPLQSTTNDSTGLTAPSANTLQAPAPSSEQLQVINNDADGGPQSPTSSGPNLWGWLFFTVLFALIAAATAWFMQRRRRPRPAHSTNRETLATAESASDEVPPAEPMEPTSSQRLRVTIDKPVAEVFAFVLNPENTPKCVDVIAHEETNEHPPKLGTIYTNRDAQGNEAEYELTEFKKDMLFTLTRAADGYHVTYTLTPSENDAYTELEYYEWVDEGTLTAPFTGAELAKLKTVMETPEP